MNSVILYDNFVHCLLFTIPWMYFLTNQTVLPLPCIWPVLHSWSANFCLEKQFQYLYGLNIFIWKSKVQGDFHFYNKIHIIQLCYIFTHSLTFSHTYISTCNMYLLCVFLHYFSYIHIYRRALCIYFVCFYTALVTYVYIDV